jgi:hypothetical protein
MTEQYRPIADLLDRVRSRWRRLVAFRATIRAALAATAALTLVLLLAMLTTRSPLALAALAAAAVALIAGAVVWGLRPLRETPSDARIARFIEERKTELDERLVSAVSVAAAERTALSASMVRDAARAAASIDPAEIVAAEVLRRSGMQAVAAVLLFVAVALLARDKARQSYDALALALFPSHVVLDVTPGDARIQAGSSLAVQARLVGNRAPVVAQLLRADGAADDQWQALEMSSDAAGRFALSLNGVNASFRYRVVAGTVTSKTFSVAVVRPPRVRRIDVEYSYPHALALPPRVEEDGGDIYAPAGTDVRVAVHTDLPAASGRMMLSADKGIDLAAGPDGVLRGSLKVVADGAYRIALADAEGLTSRGDTEYFIRILEDRPPEVHVVRPASDRRVTRLEEVPIEAEASDDFGVASFDLVYSVRGGSEKVVRLAVPPHATSVTAHHTLYLEDLDVSPGDFVSYYVRARDLARGKASSEARSDIFFLDVKPFEEEFTLAQSQAAMGGGRSGQQIDDLVAAQKQIIVATWKLDRRSKAARGAQSQEDIRSIGRAESDLKTRAEQASSTFRQSTMRDPRGRPAPGRGGQPAPPVLRAGQTLAEEDAMGLAAAAMGRAVASLDALKTADAVAPEMAALNQLLKAQADVKQRQVQQQQAGGGSGGNRNIQDTSSLFDKELARHQQTNYETPKSAAAENDDKASAIDKIKDLARRQDELLKRQQNLARDREQLNAEELKRQLESLTRDQNDLRQRAEDLAQQMARPQADQSGQPNQQNGQQSQSGQQSPGQPPQPGQQSSSGQPSQSGQQNRSGQPNQPGQQGQSARAGENGKEMRDISEEMRGATSDLRRQETDQASARAAKALAKLRDLERQLEAGSPDGRRRTLGDLQLEARQLADAERQIASESSRARQKSSSEAGKDTLRRLAGEQDRLADRVGRVQDGLKQQAAPGARTGASKDAKDVRALQEAAGNAAREMDRQRLGQRLRQSAGAMRAAADPKKASGSEATGPSSDGTLASQEDLARALDRLADTLAAADRPDGESRKLTSQLAQTQELRERLDDLTRQLGQLDQAARAPNPGAKPGGRTGTPPKGQSPQPASQSTPAAAGQPGEGQGGSGGSSADVARLREEVNREMQQVRELLDQARRDDPSRAQGGSGLTFEGQGMTLSAPGTEAFKQDFAKWQELKRQASAALEQVESTLAKKLQAQNAKDRLAAGADDQAPAAYQQQVDSYFKALATKRKP